MKITVMLKKVKPPFRPDPLKMNLDEKESQKGEQDFRKMIASNKGANLPVIFGQSFYYESPQEGQIKSVYKEWIAHTNLHQNQLQLLILNYQNQQYTIQPNTPCVGSYHSQGRQAKSQDIIPLVQSVKNNPRSRQIQNQKQQSFKAVGQKSSLEKINQERKFFSKI